MTDARTLAPGLGEFVALCERMAAQGDGGSPPDIAAMRTAYEATCRALHPGRPEGVSAEEHRAGDVPVRVYTAGRPNSTVLYIHGGGWALGGLDSHDDICARICDRTGFRVVGVDYRLAPEHKHPAAFDDCRMATDWALATFAGRLVLAGDSAGGNLAAAVARAMTPGEKRITGQVLIYPALAATHDSASCIENAEAPMLTRADLFHYDRLRSDGPVPADDPRFAPLSGTDFSGLPPTAVFTAELDPLRDDGAAYCAQLSAAGVPAHRVNETGLVHAYLRARTLSPRARESVDAIILAIETLGQGKWCWD